MKLNPFKKKQTGWEVKDLMHSLQNEPSALLHYSKLHRLSAINSLNDRFVVIRKFAARESDGKIDMLNSPARDGGEHYPISQFGMTLVSVSDSGASCHNVILPNSLDYKSVELSGETISIHHSNGTTVTNFKEINCLWTLENLEETEILRRFTSLTNLVIEPEEIEKSSEELIEDDFFGRLKLNQEFDWYEATKDEIEFSFTNTALDQLTQNLRKTEKLLPALAHIENSMVEEMLALKNESWLEDGDAELSKREFQKEIKIYGVNTYEEGSVHIYYKANDLFWGHEIQTSLDDEQKYESSTIVG